LEKKKEYEEIYYFSYFKKLFESWEESTNKLMDVWMNSPLMERAVEKSSEFKSYIHSFMEQTLEQRYLPESKITDLQTSAKKSKPKAGTRSPKNKVKEKKQ
jgi:hypothetical protein